MTQEPSNRVEKSIEVQLILFRLTLSPRSITVSVDNCPFSLVWGFDVRYYYAHLGDGRQLLLLA